METYSVNDSFFFFLFVVNFVIHWNETAMGLHTYLIPNLLFFSIFSNTIYAAILSKGFLEGSSGNGLLRDDYLFYFLF